MPTDPRLIRFCKIWDKVTDYFFDLELYYSRDYERLRCFMEDGRAELRVGSAPGHAARLDLEKGTFEYYDDDDSVNLILYNMLREKGFTCRYEPQKGVFCNGVRENLEELAKALATATSMDLRLRFPEDFWGKDFEKIDGKCRDIEDVRDRELCAVSEVLKKASKLIQRVT